MKVESCDVIKDLLPLYVDKLCRKDSAELVEEHVQNCEDCHKVLSKMKEDLRAVEVISKEELGRSRAPFKKIRNRVALLSVFIVILTVALTSAPSLYRELTVEKYNITIESNIQDIDFADLTKEMASTLRADDETLYDFMGFNWIDIDKNSEILMFNTSFVIFRNNEPLHFETQFKKNGQLEIRRSWDPVTGNEKGFARALVSYDGRESAAFMEFPLRLLEEIPWDHLFANVNPGYDKINISNMRTGDGQGNIWVDADVLKTYLINETGEIVQLKEKSVVPSQEYQVINFSPAVYLNKNSSSGRMEVQYLFKIK